MFEVFEEVSKGNYQKKTDVDQDIQKLPPILEIRGTSKQSAVHQLYFKLWFSQKSEKSERKRSVVALAPIKKK